MKFFQDITLGQYLPGDSFLHRLDPRTKFLSLILLMIVAFWIRTFPAMAALWAVFLLALALSGFPPSFVLRGVRSFLWLFLFTAAVHLFSTPGRSLPFFPLSFINLTWEGAEKGGFVAVQLFGAVFISSLMTLTTSPLQMSHGLGKLLAPLKRFHVPVEDFALMAMLAVKFIPILLEETNRIIKAQSARGVDFEYGNFFRRAKNLVPILIPIFHGVFRRAEDLTVAMLARGYATGARRTHLYELQMSPRDYLTLMTIAAFAIGEIMIN